MTKYKAIIRFADEPIKMIKWFTNNFDKEIGALGIGELKNGELVVERLVFPKQIVNGGHVHFKPEDWAPIVQELTMEEIGKICFYWHKHPGSASASSDDEENTFDVFMDKDSERPFFGFMQTAKKYNGEFEYEARIELREPVWCSITNVEIKTDESDEMADICQKIIDERITVGNASAKDQPGMKVEKETIVVPQIENKVSDKFIFEVKKKNGALLLNISPYLVDYIADLLDSDLFNKYIKKYAVDIVDDDESKIVINPKKKCINKLYHEFKTRRDEMSLTSDDTQQTLEGTINQDVYAEEEDIRASQDKYGKAVNDDWEQADYYMRRGY